MENDKLKKFLKKEQENNIIDERDGLLERVDKKFVTKDGKMLLKEQLHETN